MIIEFQPPCYVQGRQPPDQAAQSHIQPGLECLQAWGIHNLLGQPVPVKFFFPLFFIANSNNKRLTNILPLGAQLQNQTTFVTESENNQCKHVSSQLVTPL